MDAALSQAEETVRFLMWQWREIPLGLTARGPPAGPALPAGRILRAPTGVIIAYAKMCGSAGVCGPRRLLHWETPLRGARQ